MKENVNYYSNRKENLCCIINSTKFFLILCKLKLIMLKTHMKHKFTVILCTETDEDIEIQNFINKCWINLHELYF